MSQGDPDSTETPPQASSRPDALGRAVKVLRTVRDLSRRELAEAAGLSYSYLAEIENGGKQPSSRALAAIAEALGLSASQLLGEAEELAGTDEVLSSGRVEVQKPVKPTPGGARARQMRWYQSRRMGEEQASELALESQLFSAADHSDAWAEDGDRDLDRRIRELIRLVRKLPREDQERVLDLARRLAG
jgi:transcriptional regulator with XRE-family HTH domain